MRFTLMEILLFLDIKTTLQMFQFEVKEKQGNKNKTDETWGQSYKDFYT